MIALDGRMPERDSIDRLRRTKQMRYVMLRSRAVRDRPLSATWIRTELP
jgi:hypothetical protein